MIYKQFKELKLSALGFGTMRLPRLAGGAVDQQAVDRQIDRAMEAGVNYYDTAYAYVDSLSEIAIGKALARHPRESFYLADKFPGHQIVKGVTELEPEAVFEEQLKKCGVEYFDFYLMHNVNENSLAYYCDSENKYMDYFVEQKRLGRIKHLGFSCHADLEGMKQFLDMHGEHMEFCQIQLNYLDWTLQDAKAKVELLDSLGLPIWVMEPVRGGKLSKLDSETEEKMRALRPGDSISSWAFRWLQTVPRPFMVLSGMNSLEQVEDNIRTFSEEKPLSEEEIELVYAAAQKLEKLVPCTGCRYCCAGCPMELDIPGLLNLSNDLTLAYSINIVARYYAIDENHRADSCIGCGQCMHACPQKINVPQALSDYAERMAALDDWETIARTRNAIAQAVMEQE